jgi:hypothetical protein
MVRGYESGPALKKRKNMILEAIANGLEALLSLVRQKMGAK